MQGNLGTVWGNKKISGSPLISPLEGEYLGNFCLSATFLFEGKFFFIKVLSSQGTLHPSSQVEHRNQNFEGRFLYHGDT